MTTKIKPVYKSNDGESHATAKAAERRNDLIKAASEMESAIRQYVRCLADNAVTADGQQFNSSSCLRDYFYIARSWDMPTIHRVSFYIHDMHAEIDKHSQTVVLRSYDHDKRNYVSYRINELYAEEGNAIKKQVELMEERLAEMRNRIKEVRQRKETT